MKNPLNDIEVFAAVSGGISIGFGLAALLTLPSAASGDFIVGAIAAGLISVLSAIASAKIKKSDSVDINQTESEDGGESCDSDIIISEVSEKVKEEKS